MSAPKKREYDRLSDGQVIAEFERIEVLTGSITGLSTEKLETLHADMTTLREYVEKEWNAMRDGSLPMDEQRCETFERISKRLTRLERQVNAGKSWFGFQEKVSEFFEKNKNSDE